MARKSNKPELKLLGRSDVAFPKSPSKSTLETFPNRNPDRHYEVLFECPEFTSLCPVTGQADFAKITIRYIPGNQCIESKSLKFYLASFRSTPSFGEDVANRILSDFVAVVKPRFVEVLAEFSPRGGISLNVRVDHTQPEVDDIPF
jgi:7-cyano-7-deazaguanine reductase